ncbi:hypothetical protein [Calothrix sp. NIES-2098]|uniref:hypothetical protein n=1 Tax=Calothrix sp. NIES-2098 TaxID=1954171 RepID=UPI0030DCBE51
MVNQELANSPLSLLQPSIRFLLNLARQGIRLVLTQVFDRLRAFDGLLRSE